MVYRISVSAQVAPPRAEPYPLRIHKYFTMGIGRKAVIPPSLIKKVITDFTYLSYNGMCQCTK